jgi:formylglycine-generating enzyme required for sulfatase activity
MKKMFHCAAALLLLTTLNLQPTTAFAQGTAFTYQGQLQNNGSPASGIYNLTFSLFNTNATGVAIAVPVTNNTVAVTNGLFTVLIDFGPGVFTGATDWLEIALETNGVNTFTTLAPRQQLTPTPYAIFAGAAGGLSGTLPVSQVSGVLPLAQLPAAVMTNYATSVTLVGYFTGNFGGSFYGNGSGLTGLNPADLSAGTAAINISGNAATATTATTAANLTGNVSDAQLSANIARLNGTNNFTSTNTFVGVTIATNVNNVIGGTFLGNGGGLTNLNTAQFANSVLTNGETGITLGGTFTGNVSGNGGGLTNVTAATLAIPQGMALIPAGTFSMGDSLDGESDAMPTTNITVSAFYMDVNLVSYAQWQSVFFWATNQGYGFVNVGAGKAANHPVQTVDWYDSVKWSNARSQQAGLTPVYYTDAGFAQVFTNGDIGTTVYQNLAANGYRLPTEAEWEKAARGGLSGQRFPWGNVITENLANYDGATASFSYDLGPDGYNTAFTNGVTPYTSPVGYFAPNGYGLYDMAGNLEEWCWDWYGTPCGQPTNMNPTGPATGSVRVLRGGYWNNLAYYARCANRNYTYPIYANLIIGFRCVRGH